MFTKRCTTVLAVVASAFAVACYVVPLRAETLALDAVGSGWYRDSGYHIEGNRNYIAGYEYDCRNYFIFDLSGVTGTVTAAVLRLNTYETSLDGPLTYTLFDVGTPIDELGRADYGAAIHEDLGDGQVYGSRTYVAGDRHSYREIALSDAFLRDANAGAGGKLAIGGAVTSSAAGGYIFGWSCGAPGDVQLVLTCAPAIARAPAAEAAPLPSSAAAMAVVMAALAGCQVFRRRRLLAAAHR